MFSCPNLRRGEDRTEFSKGFLHTLLICVPISYANTVSYNLEEQLQVQHLQDTQDARKIVSAIRTSPDGPEPTTTTLLPAKESGERYILECCMTVG